MDERTEDSPTVSVVLPCYGAAPVARDSVTTLAPVLDRAFDGRWEIIVVDDGGSDFGADPWFPDDRVRLLRFTRNRGKGAAVREGMISARGACRVYTDVDLPYGVPIMLVMIREILRGTCHVALGDRRLPGSSYHAEVGNARRILSGLCSTFVGTLVTGGFFDTQCGLKAARGDVAERLFAMTRIQRFGFDVEVIYLALRFNCGLRRFPVQLQDQKTPSTVRLVRDSLQAVVDILGIKSRAVRGLYDDPELIRLLTREIERELEEVREVAELTPAGSSTTPGGRKRGR